MWLHTGNPKSIISECHFHLAQDRSHKQKRGRNKWGGGDLSIWARIGATSMLAPSSSQACQLSAWHLQVELSELTLAKDKDKYGGKDKKYLPTTSLQAGILGHKVEGDSSASQHNCWFTNLYQHKFLVFIFHSGGPWPNFANSLEILTWIEQCSSMLCVSGNVGPAWLGKWKKHDFNLVIDEERLNEKIANKWCMMTRRR